MENTIYMYRGGSPDKISYAKQFYRSNIDRRLDGDMILIDSSREDEYISYMLDNLKNGYKNYLYVASSEYLYDKLDDKDFVDLISSGILVAPVVNDIRKSKYYKSNLRYLDKDYIVPSIYWDGSQLFDKESTYMLSTYKSYIIKPIKESGNRGISVLIDYEECIESGIDTNFPFLTIDVRDVDSLSSYLNESYKGVACVIQPLLDNRDQLNVDAVIIDGEVHDYVIHRKLGNELYARWTDGAIDHTDRVRGDVEKALNHIVKSLGIESGLINPELLYHEGKYKIFEVNMRYSTTMGIPIDLTYNTEYIYDLLAPLLAHKLGKDLEGSISVFSDTYRGCYLPYKRHECSTFTKDIIELVRS